MINWETTYAAIWRSNKEILKPIKFIDEVNIDELINIDLQKVELINNTEKFIKGLPSNNALLWGARGTGKSSLIKAIFTKYLSKKLRLIELDRDELDNLLELLDLLRDEPYKFIIYCDDLSFEEGEKDYKKLKRVMEGSIEKKPENIIFYATSNRRHLIPEYIKDNHNTNISDDGEINYSDAIEEKISLSDRFGLLLNFNQGKQEDYLNLIDFYFRQYDFNKEVLYNEAIRFAQRKSSKSGRTAKQFFNYYLN